MVLLRKSYTFKLVDHKAVTSNCLAVQLKSASNQELEIAFIYNPNDETDKISNLSKALSFGWNGNKNQLIIGDYNTSLNTELGQVDYSQDPHRGSREFLHGLEDFKKMKSSSMCTDFCTPMILTIPGKYTTLKKDPEKIWQSQIIT